MFGVIGRLRQYEKREKRMRKGRKKKGERKRKRKRIRGIFVQSSFGRRASL